MSNLFYLISWAIPLSAMAGMCLGGVWSLMAPGLFFIVFPLVDQLVGKSEIYPRIEPVKPYSMRWFYYQGILWGYFACMLALVSLFWFKQSTFSVLTWAGLFLSLVPSYILLGNILHEMIHRCKTVKSRWYDHLFLHMIALFTGCIFLYPGHVETHHHKTYTASDLDQDSSASKHINYFRMILNMDSQKNSWKYLFFFMICAVIPFSLKLFFFLVTLHGSILLALLIGGTLFYTQHYGLRRETDSNGKLEPYTDRFTWECSFIFSNFLFLNLPRHAHHHDHQAIEYWKLKHRPEAPQLPYGYFVMMLCVLCPPLFFKIMNPRVDQEMAKTRVLYPLAGSVSSERDR